eukprot:scaffold8642_cov105-Cylindrotheca_fusiformis.AAC.4
MPSTWSFSPFPLPKLVLLDRDGVINKDVGAPGVLRKSQFQLTPDAGRAIGKLKRMGCRVVVITNQSCVGKKLLSQSELEEIHDAMRQMLCKADECAVLDQIYVCTSVDDNDRRKKPNPGMIFEACRDHGVDASESVFVGDNLTDMQAAQAAGVTKRILVETGYGRGLMGDQSASIPPKVIEKSLIEKSLPEMSTVAPFVYAPNLAAAATWLVREQEKNEL